MCGISGFVERKRPASQSDIDAMLDTIRRRGPDGRGSFVEESVAIGMTRLAIIDLETGDQPIFNEDRSIAIVCNGEIYNFRALRKELEAAGHRFSTNSDSEVIVHLYEEHGDRAPEYLQGMFAFAVFDRRRKRVLLARDRLGIKPLFIAETDDRIVFGSEIKALLCDPGIDSSLDPQALFEFMTYTYIPYPLTIHKGIRKVPPAHTV